jgi:hypothetical protein
VTSAGRSRSLDGARFGGAHPLPWQADRGARRGGVRAGIDAHPAAPRAVDDARRGVDRGDRGSRRGGMRARIDARRGGMRARIDARRGGVWAVDDPRRGGDRAVDDARRGGKRAVDDPRRGGVWAVDDPRRGGVWAVDDPRRGGWVETHPCDARHGPLWDFATNVASSGDDAHVVPPRRDHRPSIRATSQTSTGSPIRGAVHLGWVSTHPRVVDRRPPASRRVVDRRPPDPRSRGGSPTARIPPRAKSRGGDSAPFCAAWGRRQKKVKIVLDGER